MVRRFVDLMIRPKSEEEGIKMIETAADLGIKAVAVETSNDIYENLKKVGASNNVDVYRRITLKVNSKESLYEMLSKVRWSYDVVSVTTSNKEVSIAASRDNRVDTLVISSQGSPVLDKHVLAVAVNAFEVIFLDLITHGFETLDLLKKSFKLLSKKKAKIVASSGATNSLEMRSPRQLAGMLITFGLAPQRALDAVSSLPEKILVENSSKLSGGLDPSGVWRIEG